MAEGSKESCPSSPMKPAWHVPQAWEPQPWESEQPREGQRAVVSWERMCSAVEAGGGGSSQRS